MTTHHRYAVVQGRRLFYREAGEPSAPAVVLLHGFPSSSYMFRDLIPLLCDQHRVIAPDYLGFGHSDAPSPDDFEYTFDSQAGLVSGLLTDLGVREYSMYVHDYGAPIGWRLALKSPDSITAIVSQSGNAYESGFTSQFWQPIWDYAHNPNPETEAGVRPALSCQSIMWQYQHGVPDPSVIDPDTWNHDAALVARPGNDQIQLAMFRDYLSNFEVYDRVHQYFRESQVPLMALWGRNDQIFGPVGAIAFQVDLSDAEVHLMDGGHFLLESHLSAVGERVKGFLGHKRAAASVALIAGIAAGPIAGTAATASAAPPHTGSDVAATQSTSSSAQSNQQPNQQANQQSNQQSNAPSAQQLMPLGAPDPSSQSSLNLDSSQIANAHAIVNASNAMHLPPRAAVIAVATSMQETKLTNYGNLGGANDHDSLGLFQQRPSSGWGSPDQLTDPTYAATAFLKALTQVPGWDSMPLTDAAQAVQVSAFGDRYAQWEQQASDLVLSNYHAGPYANTG